MFTHTTPTVEPSQDEPDKSMAVQSQSVSLATYWQSYYHDVGDTYEYNDGLLEEKPMARQVHADMFIWFSSLIHRYLEAHPIGRVSSLAIGFETECPHKQVHRPDLAIVLHTNPIPFDPLDMKYEGIFDLCVEIMHGSCSQDIDRTVSTKFKAYEMAGVKEYWLLSDNAQKMGFYRLNNTQGHYQAVPLTAEGVWISRVLPAFQLRRSDLIDLPSHDGLVNDPVYAGYISPNYQRMKERAQQQLERERQRTAQERLAKEKLMEALRQQGVDPKQFL